MVLDAAALGSELVFMIFGWCSTFCYDYDGTSHLMHQFIAKWFNLFPNCLTLAGYSNIVQWQEFITIVWQWTISLVRGFYMTRLQKKGNKKRNQRAKVTWLEILKNNNPCEWFFTLRIDFFFCYFTISAVKFEFFS